jgi:type I restriction enzyme S subunit
MSGDWPLKTLADVTIRQDYGSSAKASASVTDGTPMVRMGNIRNGVVELSRDVKYLPSEHPDVTKYKLLNGDLLFNRTNSPELVGKTAVFHGASGDACFASYLIRVRLDERVCLPEWASIYLNSPRGRAWAASVRSQQVGQANINGSKLAALPLPVPTVDEQRRIVNNVEGQIAPVKHLIAVIERSLVRSQQLRAGILNYAFAGRLTRPLPDDEPPSVLLDRIRARRSSLDGRRPKRATGRPIKQGEG